MLKVRVEREQKVVFNVSNQEKELIVRAAQDVDMSISDFCRRVLFDYIKKEDKDDDC